MSKVNELIKKLCPNGVKFYQIKDIAKVTIGEFVHKNKQSDDSPYPVYNGGTSNTGFYDEFNNDGHKVIISARGANAGFINRVEGKYWAGNSCYTININDESQLNWNYLYQYLKNNQTILLGVQQTGSIPAISKKQVEEFKIAIPPLEVQKEIVKILDKFGELEAELEVELEARKSQYEFWRNKLLNEEYEIKYLPELSDNLDNKRKPVTKSDRESGVFPYYGASGIVDYVSNYIFDDELLLISEDGANLKARSTPIAFSSSGKVWVNNHAHVLKFYSRITQKYVEHYLNMIDLSEYITGAAQPKLNQENLNKIRINIPSSIKEQEKIVTVLERFDRLINDISSGLPAEIELRKKQYEYYRNKLLSFKEL